MRNLFGAAICFVLFGGSTATTGATIRARVVQYNAEWLYLNYYSPANCPGTGCSWHNLTIAANHMDHVTSALSSVLDREKPADITLINLCEVEGSYELATIANALGGATLTPYFVQGTDTATGQNVGLLSNIAPLRAPYRVDVKLPYPVPDSTCPTPVTGAPATGTEGVSKHAVTEFAIGDLKIAFIAAHLLAIPTDPVRCVQREAQAAVLQEYVIYPYIAAGYEILLVGDLNDYDGEIVDANNNQPVSSVLDILKGIRGKYATKYDLYGVTGLMKRKDRYTNWWDSDSNCATSSDADYAAIDHILVTEGLYDVAENVSIWHGYSEYCGKLDSDHYPMVVDFLISAA